jgi:cytochrome b6-f complex iron-sulfur subunit
MDRKEFLSLLGFSSGALVVASCMQSCKKDDHNTTAPTNIDFTIDISQNPYTALATAGNYIYKDGVIVAKTEAGNIIAVSQACTHEGTSVTFISGTNNHFHCPNHGATFNTSGAVTQGPANTALKQYTVTALTATTFKITS